MEPDHYDVRANLMWCATLGLNGLISARVPQDWAANMIGMSLRGWIMLKNTGSMFAGLSGT